MNKKTKLILIPGMDGTGLLFEPLIELLRGVYDCEVICLNAAQNLSPISEINHLENVIGNNEVIILAESYSGHIAHQLSLNTAFNIKHIIYAASFLEKPTKLTFLRRFLPLWLIRSNYLPTNIVGRLLFGNSRSTDLVSLFLKALDNVEDKHLKSRLDVLHKLKPPLTISDVPSTCVLADQDYLISRSCIKSFDLYCTEINYQEAAGGHFIVQSNPNHFYRLIKKLLSD